MRTRSILFFCFVFAALLVPIATPAQQTITCESNDGGRRHCGPPNPGQVTLQRQISGSECIQDRSWGVDDRGLWVDHGCRAEFLIGGVLKADGAGKIRDAYWDKPDGALYMITSMREHKGALYFGGVTNNKIGRLALDSADPQWTGPGSYWNKV